MDTDDDGAEILTVDPPLVFGEGFDVYRQDDFVVVAWSVGERRVASLRTAMLMICPLGPEALAATEVHATTFLP